MSARVLRLEAAAVAPPPPGASALWLSGADGTHRRLELRSGRVSRAAVAPPAARLVAVGEDAGRTPALLRSPQAAPPTFVADLLRSDCWPGAPVPVEPVLGAAFAGGLLVVVGRSSVSGFVPTQDSVKRRWTRPLHGLSGALVARAAGGHVAVAYRDAIALVEVSNGRVVDHLAFAGGPSGFAVDGSWRHWLLWRAGEAAVHRAGRDGSLGRWRFERIALPHPCAAAAVYEDGRAVLADARGALSVHARGDEAPAALVDLGQPVSALHALHGARGPLVAAVGAEVLVLVAV